MRATASELWADLAPAPFARGGRTVAGIDCLGVVLLLAKARGILFPDPWHSVRHAWIDGCVVVSGFPRGWRRVDGCSPIDDDVVLIAGDQSRAVGCGYVLGGLCWTAQPGHGVVRLPVDRVPIAEVWRCCT